MLDAVVTISSRPSWVIERREDGGVVGFGAAGREHDLVVEGGAEQRLQALARLLHRARDFDCRKHGPTRRFRTGRRNTAASPRRRPGPCASSHCCRDRSAARKASFNAAPSLRPATGMRRTNSPSFSTMRAWIPSSVALLSLQNTQAPVSLTMTLLPSISISSQSPPSPLQVRPDLLDHRLDDLDAIGRPRRQLLRMLGFNQHDLEVSFQSTGLHSRIRRSLARTQPNDFPQEQLDRRVGIFEGEARSFERDHEVDRRARQDTRGFSCRRTPARRRARSRCRRDRPRRRDPACICSRRSRRLRP